MQKEKQIATEKQIIEAARSVFIKKGMAGARMQEIADKAGINKAMLHYYFRSKEALFSSIFMDAFNQIIPAINNIINEEMSLFVKIKNFTSTYLTLLNEHPFLPAFVINELNHNPTFIKKLIENKQLPQPTVFIQQIKNEIKMGSIRDISPQQLIVNMISMCLFPFIAKPMFTNVFQMQEKQFAAMMENRAEEIANFIIESIKLK